MWWDYVVCFRVLGDRQKMNKRWECFKWMSGVIGKDSIWLSRNDFDGE